MHVKLGRKNKRPKRLIRLSMRRRDTGDDGFKNVIDVLPGFGYTTNDSNLSGGTANRFTAGGPKHAGFTTATPGDPVADHTEVIEDPTVTNEQFTITYRVTASETTTAGAYTNTVIYVVVPTY